MSVRKLLLVLVAALPLALAQPAQAQRRIPGAMRFSFRPGFAHGLTGIPGAMRFSYRPGFSFGLRGLPGMTRGSYSNFYNPYAYTHSYLRHPYGFYRFYPRSFGYEPYAYGHFPYVSNYYYPYRGLLYGYPYGYGYPYSSGAYPYFSNPYAPLYLSYGALTLGALSGSGGYGGYGMLGLGLNLNLGGGSDDTNAAGAGAPYAPPPPREPSPAEKMQNTILSATGLPTFLGKLEWPLGLRILPGADPLRRRIDSLYEIASAQAMTGKVNPLLPKEMRTAVRKFERFLALNEVEKYTLCSNQYEIGERFLHRLERSANLFLAMAFPKPADIYSPRALDGTESPSAPPTKGY